MYRALFTSLKTYWREYGGLKSLLSSPFTHFALAITVVYKIGFITLDWRKIALDSLPTMLGFSLAAYTITFTLMGSALHRALTTAIDRSSGLPLIKIVNATFFHIVTFQSAALLFSLTTDGHLFFDILKEPTNQETWRSPVLWAIVQMGDATGAFLSIYAYFLLFSVAFAMFRLGRLTMSSSQSSPPVSNDNAADTTPLQPEVIGTWRFAVVKFVAKALRLYDK